MACNKCTGELTRDAGQETLILAQRARKICMDKIIKVDMRITLIILVINGNNVNVMPEKGIMTIIRGTSTNAGMRMTFYIN